MVTTATDLLTLENDGFGDFASPASRAALTTGVGAAAADFDRDGRTDVVASDAGTGQIAIALGNQAYRCDPRPGRVRQISANGRVYASVGRDFNHDGKIDLAAACWTAKELGIFLGDGAGSFLPPTRILLAAEPVAVESADLDNDGEWDLVVCTINNVYTYLGDGAGGFALNQNQTVVNQIRDVELADVNEDGDIDALISLWDGGRIGVLIGDGAGSLAAPVNTPHIGGQPSLFALADLNEDQHLDLVAPVKDSTQGLSILLGDGTGTFGAPTTYVAGTDGYAVAVADFNNDTHLDVASAAYTSEDTHIFLGDGTGALTFAATYPTPTHPQSILAHDIDRDGNIDLLVGTKQPSTAITALAGDGLGGFALAGNYPINVGVRDLDVLDADHDGLLDLIVSSDGAGGISAFLGNGAGTLDGLRSMPLPFDPNGGALADINRDNVPDLLLTGNGELTPAFGDGTGLSIPSSGISTGGTPVFVATADFNLDGNLDAAVSDIGVDSVLFLPGDGTGGFGAQSGVGIARPGYLACVDMNRDGRPDLVCTLSFAKEVWVLLNTTSRGAATFTFAFATSESLPDAASSLVTADFDRDGNLDLALGCANNDLLLFFGDGTGQLPASQTFVGAAQRAAVGDLNQDGIADLVCTVDTPNAVRVWLGDGTGGFSPGSPLVQTRAASCVQAEDIDGDGALDVLVAYSLSHRWFSGDGLGSLTYRSATPIGDGLFGIADLDGNGLLDATSDNVAGLVATALAGR